MTETITMPGATGEIYARYLRLIEAGPARARDAAATLGVSEAELVAAKVGAGFGSRLRPAEKDGFAGLLRAMPGVGEVMVLTRNAHCVHESHGTFGNVDIGETMGLVVNGGVDLRLFMRHWASGFALEEEMASGKRLSLQFFDREGVAVHKIYATDATDRGALEALIADWRDDAPGPLEIDAYAREAAVRPDAEVDTAALGADWRAMGDAHEFHGLLRRHRVGRTQALRLAGGDLARRVDVGAATAVLEAAAAREVPILIFVQSRGCVQIHNGPVKRIAPAGPWINVLDPKFNLHLRQDRVAEAWVVRKPVAGGWVTGLELYAEDASTICIVMGRRVRGENEREDWREILAALTEERAP